MEQRIRFCRGKEGVRIAYATAGEGYPLVKVANWLSHLEFDWTSPVWRHWLTELTASFFLVRYDERGWGLSDWTVDEPLFDHWVEDLEAVTEAVGLERFALLALSQGGPVAIAYAVRHPERVSHLILYGSYARGWLHRHLSPEQHQEEQIILDLIRIGWGRDNPAFRQFFTFQLLPNATKEQIEALDQLMRVSATPANAAVLEAAMHRIDVRHLAPQVRVPTLILHPTDDAAVPFEEGRLLAALIPDSRFVPLTSKNHILLEDEPAWPRFLSEVRRFVEVPAPPSSTLNSQLTPFALTRREREVAHLLAQGKSNQQIAEELVVSVRTVEGHVSNILDKLGVESRTQVATWAIEHGLG